MISVKSIPLESYSVDENLVLMDRLWEILSRRPGDVPSPELHGDVLSSRLIAVREGNTSFVDWDDAKKRLQDRLK